MPPSSGPAKTESKAALKGAQKSPPEIRIKVSWCKGCGLCVEYCNRGAITMDGVIPKVVAADRCSRCLQCEAICPDFAIEIVDTDEGEAAEGKR